MFELRVSSDPRFLVIIRGVVGQFCGFFNCTPEEERKIVLAVDEACTNIIRHTYHGDQNQSIEIFCKDNDNLLEIVLQDCGPPLDLDRIRSRNLDEIRPGGLGTHFIRTVMDEVNYSHKEGGGNILRMVKHFHKALS